MLNLLTRKLKILFEVTKLCFLMKKRKEQYIEFTLLFLSFFFYSFHLTSTYRTISTESTVKLVKFFPDSTDIDPHASHGKFSNILAHIRLAEQIAEFLEERKSIFPLTDCYQLLLTIPVTVAKDERTFSHLKIVKTPLRTTMDDKKLESLLLLSCEKEYHRPD